MINIIYCSQNTNTITIQQHLRNLGLLNKSLNISYNAKHLFETNEPIRQEILSLTHFLNAEADLRLRITCLLLSIDSQPKCETCNDDILRLNKTNRTIPIYCGKMCVNKRKMAERRAKNNIDKFGVVGISQLPEIKHKIKQTFLERYGVENAMHVPAFEEKKKQTCFNKYGTSCTATLPSVLLKRQRTSYQRYGFSVKSTYSDYTKEKLMNAEWLFHQYTTEGKSINQIANDLNVYGGVLSTYFAKYEIPIDKYRAYTITSSKAEKEITDFIQNINVGTVISGDRKQIHPKELDIYIPSLKIAVEYNGILWHSESKNKNHLYHLNKTNACKNVGIDLIHIDEDVWVEKPQVVKQFLLHHLMHKIASDEHPGIVSTIPSKQAENFISQNSLYETAPLNSTALSLKKEDGNTVGVLCFVQQGEDEYRIVVCESINETLSNSLKPLLDYFVTEYNPKRITVVHDKRIPVEFNLFVMNNGFKPLYETTPTCKYFTLSNVMNFLTESEIDPQTMTKYSRIWDCGTSVWEWRRE